ncbi:MAG TPA: CBS domain-containing protein [Pyrinomonadaceae bacterium]|jgi:CBS domain-containing protein|nr:CBS domain-containing protein [Pyrinomonadaceae bacterium]
MLIRDVIRDREPYSMKATATVMEAAEFMARRRIGAVCVLNEDNQLIGVFSERDLLNRVVVPRRDPTTLRLGDVTSELRAVIRCDETPHQALDRMDEIGSRHLPVIDGDDHWVGMLSMRDLLRVEVSEQGDELKLLHDYISQ